MKKPDITEGVWEYDNENYVLSDYNGGLTICVVDYVGSDKEEETANAKAISAVPEMIDALIEARKTLKSVAKQFDFPEEMQESEVYQKIEQALKKAGAS